MAGREYLLTVVLTAFVCGLAELLLPDGEEGSGRAFGLLASLLVLCVIIAPISRLTADGMDEIKSYADAFFDGLSGEIPDESTYRTQLMACILSSGEADAERAVSQQIAHRFALSADELQVRLAWSAEDAETVRLSGVTVLLSGAAVFADPYAIEDYLEMLFGVECKAALA